MLNLTTVAPLLQKTGVYGPVTATLDWCELNHQFSPYIAEMANTFSNLFTVGIALLGYVQAAREKLPVRYKLGYAGVGLVGIGSFLFHATLLFSAQLADELPMIYVGSMSLFLLFDSKPGFGLANARSQGLIAALVVFDAVFTLSYMLYRNPVYHQLVFATLVISTTLRITYILQYTSAATRIPPKKKSAIGHIFSTGAGLFAFGFFLWNLDNIFCGRLTVWKVGVGWPGAFLLEGHSWWHVLTGLGSYYMFIGIQFV
ncbi:Alkaline ceramidase 3 [Psilocybe cubensis]|uniref:Alkaline ceramidase 3 n=1 Tax=Psilocybe cubensis TaxID=181762 RepID=A0ACB8HF02_PSICU|nr:Alkaline ceramidase 3 [Psilocybe cubensis]KAH9486287.1 Alkaline ceramidase 3 [Psilocybe cubensis]